MSFLCTNCKVVAEVTRDEYQYLANGKKLLYFLTSTEKNVTASGTSLVDLNVFFLGFGSSALNRLYRRADSFVNKGMF